MARLRFTINGAAYNAVLRDDSLTERIAAMCPFELEYARGGDHEYYTALPQKTTAEGGCPPTSIGKRNALYYFEDWNALSIVIKDCDTAPYKLHHIGDFKEDISAVLKNSGGKVRILCEAV